MLARQEAKSLMLENRPRANPGIAGFFHTPTSDKMMRGRQGILSRGMRGRGA
jgi:hypothetical protein